MPSNLTVIKAGTGVLTKGQDGTLDRAALVHLVSSIASLIRQGHQCLFVSSDAVGSGISALGLNAYPDETATRQACAAIGQARLMQTYSSLFKHFEITVAQVLLTADDLSTPERAAHVRDTIRRLLAQPNLIPIINENDSVAVEELKFGDNDMLSVRVAGLMEARRVILLTSTDGLLKPDSNELVKEVRSVEDVLHYVEDDKGRFSIGGMKSKLEAVRFATDHGMDAYIAHGGHPERLAGILSGTGYATHFTKNKQDNRYDSISCGSARSQLESGLSHE